MFFEVIERPFVTRGHIDRDITITISGKDPILPENFLRAARANHVGGGNNILVVNGHLFKGKDLHCRKFSAGFARSHQTKPKALLRKRDSGAERSVTFWGVAVGGGAEKTPNLDFMKRFPCKGGCGTTMISHTFRW